MKGQEITTGDFPPAAEEVKEKKKRRYLLAIPIIIAIILILLFIWIAPEWKERNMSLQVADTIGIEVSYVEITYGTIPPGGTARREVVITNLNNYDKIAQFSVEGTIRDFVVVPGDVVVGAGGNVSLDMVANVPAGAEFGNYTGKFKIFLRRAI